MTPTTISPKFICKLQKLAEEKNAPERHRVEALVEDQWKRLPDMKDFDYDKSRLVSGLKAMLSCMTGEWSIFTCTPDRISNQICQMIEYTARFYYQHWTIKKDVDPNAADEDNLECSKAVCYASYDNHVDRAVQLLMDNVLVLGKLARRIHSSILGRVVELIVKCKRINNMGAYNHDQAQALTNEIVFCWQIIQTELELLDDDEKLEIYPEKPKHDAEDDEEDFDEDQYDGTDDPDVATDEAREFALKKYRKEHADLLPKTDDNGKLGQHPMECMLSRIKSLADEMEAEKPSLDEKWYKLDYAYLSKILAANIMLMYECYERVVDGDDETSCVRLEHDTGSEETPENKYKKEIVENLRRYLTAAAKLSQKIGSSSYSQWTEMLALLEKYKGDFYGWFSFSNDGGLAKKDLKRFIALFKSARQQIWSDSKVYLPGAKKTVVDISDESTKKTAEAVGEQFAETRSNIAEIKTRIGGPNKTKADIVSLVRDILTAKIKDITSIPKAVGYIRKGVDSSDELFYDRCMWARQFAKSHAKKQKDGLEKYWRTIAQNAKPGSEGQRSKARSKGKPKVVETPVGW